MANKHDSRKLAILLAVSMLVSLLAVSASASIIDLEDRDDFVVDIVLTTYFVKHSYYTDGVLDGTVNDGFTSGDGTSTIDMIAASISKQTSYGGNSYVYSDYSLDSETDTITLMYHRSTAVTEPPVTTPPVTEPPVTNPPATEPPVTEPPVTRPPATEPPETEPPVTNPPATEPSVTQPSGETMPGTDMPDNPNNPGTDDPGTDDPDAPDVTLPEEVIDDPEVPLAPAPDVPGNADAVNAPVAADQKAAANAPASPEKADAPKAENAPDAPKALNVPGTQSQKFDVTLIALVGAALLITAGVVLLVLSVTKKARRK